MGFFCNRGDCIANKHFECSALVERNPATGSTIETQWCPFHLTREQADKDKHETLEKLRAHGRDDLIKKYWGLKNP